MSMTCSPERIQSTIQSTIIKTNSRWNYSARSIRSIRVKQMGLDLPWTIENRQSWHMPVIIRDNFEDSCILGMQCQDTFQFLCKLNTEAHIVSKRVILFEVAKLFDPLGFLSPVIVIAKLILQDLWQLAIQWDESLRTSILVGLLSEYRWFESTKNSSMHFDAIKLNAHQLIVEVHGFCDASQRAFGACIYLRSKLGLNDHHSKLLYSKSRVVPLKTVSYRD